MRYFLLVSAVFCAVNVHAQTLTISDFSQNDLSDWQQESFKDQTIYEITELEGESVLRAHSAQSASILVKSMRVDLTKTPYLNWRWRIEKRLNTIDETQKSGDA